MRLKVKLGQHRRDFRAVYQCEHCDTTVQGSGHDDENFHRNVIPAMVCPVCKKCAGPPASDAPARTIP